jgi:hypothetical protein
MRLPNSIQVEMVSSERIDVLPISKHIAVSGDLSVHSQVTDPSFPGQ